ncbi:unnamed protein product [Lasius platythorax]|uniref:Uncharacterized protein n=1 Tax=Lasius platythorax TaxID=488582 RepID=A0AAV2P0T1_9HYME
MFPEIRAESPISVCRILCGSIGPGRWTREEEIFQAKWKWHMDAAANAALLNGLRSGLPNCCAFIRNLCRILG